MTRSDGRANDELRPITFERDFTEMAAGIVLVAFGTHPGAVHRVDRRGRAAVDAGHGKGWVTAEYSMLPGCVARAHRPRGGEGQAERAARRRSSG